ncbi:MAG TPA: caspase family protein [Methylocystis sp.]|nr:caspase family protein [Methylocystis sp.]
MSAHWLSALVFAALLGFVSAAPAWGAERRIALVVGESNYRAGTLPTAANDAGLVAQTLEIAGFEVVGARDLDEDALRGALREFLEAAQSAGKDAAAVIYFAGYGVQLEGENYLLPVNAQISRDSDIVAHGLRVSDFVKPLAALGLKAAIVCLDAARANPFKLKGPGIPGGLALYEPGARALLAYNAAPGTLAPAEVGSYGAYARALAESIRVGGLSLKAVFEETRLRVSASTKGAQVPWNSSGVDSSFVFLARGEGAPPAPPTDFDQSARSLAELGPRDGYTAAVARDTANAYAEYAKDFPQDPTAKRVHVLLAARQEALAWRRARQLDQPDAYWSYLTLYPNGPHRGDARRRLAESASALDPPPDFTPIDLDAPPPPDEDHQILAQPAISLDNPELGLPPAPEPPAVYGFAETLDESPPDYTPEPYYLPLPVFVPLPLWIDVPDDVGPPPNSFLFPHRHDRAKIDYAARSATFTDSSGRQAVIPFPPVEPLAAPLPSFGAPLPSFGASLPPFGAPLPPYVAKRAATPPPAPSARPLSEPLPRPAALQAGTTPRPALTGPSQRGVSPPPLAAVPTSPPVAASPPITPPAGAPGQATTPPASTRLLERPPAPVLQQQPTAVYRPAPPQVVYPPPPQAVYQPPPVYYPPQPFQPAAPGRARGGR